MSLNINYWNKPFDKTISNVVFFSDDKFSISGFKKNLSNIEFNYINDLLKTVDLKKRILVFEISSKKKDNFDIFKK